MPQRPNAPIVRLLFAMTLLAGIIPARGKEPIPVVASFSIVGDITRVIGAERVRVHMLVGPDNDAHAYPLNPADAKLLARTRVVVTHRLGFEGWIGRLVKAAGYRGEIVVASQGIVPMAGGRRREPADGRGYSHPHAWHDVANTRR